MAYTFTTEAERTKIKMLCDLGMSVAEIHKLTGRSKDLIGRISAGTYDERRKQDAERMRQRAERHRAAQNTQKEELLDSVIEKVQAQKDEEERKRQETRRRIREEAERQGIPGYVQEAAEEAAATPASPFDNDNLLLRVADSNDYTNALLNGIMVRLEKLCAALGVSA